NATNATRVLIGVKRRRRHESEFAVASEKGSLLRLIRLAWLAKLVPELRRPRRRQSAGPAQFPDLMQVIAAEGLLAHDVQAVAFPLLQLRFQFRLHEPLQLLLEPVDLPGEHENLGRP